MAGKNGTSPGGSTETVQKTSEQLKKPPLYKVVFHNDDYTTMDFVVSVLMNVFHHTEAASFRIMMHIHTNGIGIAGVFTREVAETKVAQTVAAARKNDFPLEVTIEPE